MKRFFQRICTDGPLGLGHTRGKDVSWLAVLSDVLLEMLFEEGDQRFFLFLNILTSFLNIFPLQQNITNMASPINMLYVSVMYQTLNPGYTKLTISRTQFRPITIDKFKYTKNL